MFDVYHPTVVRNAGPSHVTVTNIEKRAPTDESVKLLAEMEKAAQAKVTGAVKVNNTAFDGVLHQMRDSLSDKILYACVFKLNGEQMRADFEVDMEKFDLEGVAIGIRDAIAEKVANKIAESVFRSIKSLDKP